MKCVIIGAGLSGLTAGYELLKKGITDFIILEARDRTGGRIISKNGTDHGATWFQNYHEHLNQLLEELELDYFHQYREGNSLLIYNSMAAPHLFQQNPDEPAARRIGGGTEALIKSLESKLVEKIQLAEPVEAMQEDGNTIRVITSNASYEAEQVIVTIPPQLASEMNFSPELHKNELDTMRNTHTWMSNSIKVSLTFSRPFWKEKGFSGTVISQISPVVELYDHTNMEETEFSLMGFVNESIRNYDTQDRKNLILEYLEKCLGSEIREFLTYQETDWSKERFTSAGEAKPLYAHPQYGNELIQKPKWNGKLIFSGTETSSVYGGYMEGAIISAKNAIRTLLMS